MRIKTGELMRNFLGHVADKIGHALHRFRAKTPGIRNLLGTEPPVFHPWR